MKTFTWATVAAISPLRLLLDGDTDPLPVAPELLISEAALLVGDRVRCELADRRVLVHGRAGGGSGGTAFPVGAIIDWPAASSTPVYALDCDGGAVSRTVYSALFGTIGTRYGAGDGSTSFNVPDLRVDSLPASARLTKSNTMSTSATPGTPTEISWTADSRDSGMWHGGDPSRIYPNRRGRWRVRAKVRGAASSASVYVQVRMNAASNSPSEGLATDNVAGAYPIAEDVFEVTDPGADYITALVMALAPNLAMTALNFLMLVDYLGPLDEYAPDGPARKIIVATDRGQGVTVVHGQGQFLGQIIGWPGHAGAPIPANCLELNGQSVSASVYTGLAALFPDWVSGDALALPDLRGHALVGYASADDTFGVLGAKVGKKTHLLTSAQSGLRDHVHQISGGWGSGGYGQGYFRADQNSPGTLWGQTWGSGSADAAQPHNNIQPSYIGRWLIVAADAAGEYSPTVQAALTARIESLESPPFGRIRLGSVAGPSIPNTTHTDVTAFQTVDAMHGMSQSGGRITITRAGWYEVRLSVAFAANASGDRIATIRKNGSGPLDTGSMIAYGPPLKGTASVHGITMTALRHWLEEGDVLTPNVWQGSGGSLALIDETLAAHAGRMNFLEVQFIRG